MLLGRLFRARSSGVRAQNKRTSDHRWMKHLTGKPLKHAKKLWIKLTIMNLGCTYQPVDLER